MDKTIWTENIPPKMHKWQINTWKDTNIIYWWTQVIVRITVHWQERLKIKKNHKHNPIIASMLARMWNWWKLHCWWWECKNGTATWKGITIYKTNTHYNSNQKFTLISLYPSEIKLCPHKNLFMNDQEHLMYNCSRLETTQMSLSWVVNEKDQYRDTV